MSFEPLPPAVGVETDVDPEMIGAERSEELDLARCERPPMSRRTQPDPRQRPPHRRPDGDLDVTATATERRRRAREMEPDGLCNSLRPLCRAREAARERRRVRF